jgi:hypothetical protein
MRRLFLPTALATLLVLPLLAAPADARRQDEDELPERSGPRDMGDEPEEEFDLLSDDIGEAEPPEFAIDEPPDDMLGLDDEPEPQARVAMSAGPGPITLDVAGKEPLADNYPLQVVAVDRDAVVVELPVLVERSRVTLEAPFTLQAEARVGEQTITTWEQAINAEALAEFGPSFAFVKLLVPVMEPQGEVTVVVRKAAPDGSGATELFRRSTAYSLK